MTEQAKAKRDSVLEKIIGDSHGAINHSTLEKVFDAGYAESQERIKQLESRVEKLKRLVLLVDDSVSNVEMNTLSANQWFEYLKEFPDEAQND